MILLIDNYDSFTYNLFQYLGELGQKIKVIRNDDFSLKDVSKMNPKMIVISPGPGRPKTAGNCLKLVQEYANKIPILGICLGHQVVAKAFGATIIHAPQIFHGKSSIINHDKKGLYKSMPQKIEVGRYHSLIISKKSLPECFIISAWTDDNIIMGIRHKTFPIEGIQFHPESILTPQGKVLLESFINNYK